MTEPEQKTFKIVCAHCNEAFTVRFPLSQAGAGEQADVVVSCLYCGKDSVVSIPSAYVPEDHLVRGLKSVPKQP